jgi:hypothetical protein
MMDAILIENWQPIELFELYDVSDHGRIRSNRTYAERILSLTPNQYGVVQVGLMRDGVQHHRSVPLLVAKAFLPYVGGAFDTPINLDGDRENNHVANLMWRPRWFAIQYNRQFRHPYEFPINVPIVNLKTGEVSANSFECCKEYGLLEKDLVLSILNRTFVWPIYQEFAILEEESYE